MTNAYTIKGEITLSRAVRRPFHRGSHNRKICCKVSKDGFPSTMR
jgi:hypothetical protein